MAEYEQPNPSAYIACLCDGAAEHWRDGDERQVGQGLDLPLVRATEGHHQRAAPLVTHHPSLQNN